MNDAEFRKLAYERGPWAAYKSSCSGWNIVDVAGNPSVCRIYGGQIGEVLRDKIIALLNVGITDQVV